MINFSLKTSKIKKLTMMPQGSSLSSVENAKTYSHLTMNTLHNATTTAPHVYNIPPPNMYIPPYNNYSENCGVAFATNPQTNLLVPPFPPPDFRNYHTTSYEPVPQYYPHRDNSNTFQYNMQLNCISQEPALDSIPNFNEYVNEKFQKGISSDEQWIESWFSRNIERKPTICMEKLVKISDTKENFKKCLSLLQELKMLKEKMQNNYQNMDAKAWNGLHQRFLDIKNAVSKKVLELPDIINLQKAVKKRCKKRAFQKRRNVRRKEAKIINSENRQVLHHKIDTWLKFMQGTIDRSKREESLKKEADSVLSEVLRKKADGRRQLALVESLLKLRQLRAKNAVNCGQHVALEDGIRFEKVAENLKTLWEKQLIEYNVEEQGMRVMLSEAVDERDQSEVSRERQILSQWDKLLFGNRPCEFPEFYLAYEKSVESFISIRQSWDKLTVSNKASVQSNIPVGWVLPRNPSSSNWESLVLPEKAET